MSIARALWLTSESRQTSVYITLHLHPKTRRYLLCCRSWKSRFRQFQLKRYKLQSKYKEEEGSIWKRACDCILSKISRNIWRQNEISFFPQRESLKYVTQIQFSNHTLRCCIKLLTRKWCCSIAWILINYFCVTLRSVPNPLHSRSTFQAVKRIKAFSKVIEV